MIRKPDCPEELEINFQILYGKFHSKIYAYDGFNNPVEKSFQSYLHELPIPNLALLEMVPNLQIIYLMSLIYQGKSDLNSFFYRWNSNFWQGLNSLGLLWPSFQGMHEITLL